jgi:hypothetical protein
MENAFQPSWLMALAHRRHEVLDLNLNTVPYSGVVRETVITVLDWCLLDPEDFTDKRSECRHWSAHLARENSRQLVRLLLGGRLVDD